MSGYSSKPLKTRNLKILVVISFLLLIGINSCKKPTTTIIPPPPPPTSVDLRDTLANYAKFAYYWNTLIPASFAPHNYSATDTFLTETEAIKSFSAIDPLTTHNLDRFSFVLSEADYQQLFVQGSSQGYGLEFRFDENGLYHIRYAAHASGAYLQGVRRGWEVDSINNFTPVNNANFFNQIGAALANPSVKMVFKDGLGVKHSLTLNSASVQDDEVVTTKILDTAGKKIGYMVYNTFLPKITPSSLHPGLDTAFAGLAAKGITDLIIDLRYNGGGYVQIVEEMANALVPSTNQGKVLFTETFNQNLVKNNVSTLVNKTKTGNPTGLNINSVTFIVSEGTASASELIINSLFPYFSNIKLIGVGKGRGELNTAGKPFGFFNYSFPSAKPQYEAFLINDETKNALNQDNYTAGFKPDIQAYDGVQYDWGNLKEYGYAEAVHYIVSGFLSYGKFNNNLAIGKTGRSSGFNLALDKSPTLKRPIGIFHLHPLKTKQ